MDGVAGYILNIIAAVIVCTVAKHLIGDKNPSGKLIKVICGVFIAVTMIAPVVDFRIDRYIDNVEQYISEATACADTGNQIAEKEMTDIIKQKMEAYILDEADRLSVKLSADISLSQDGSMLPEKVVINGAVSPYNQKVLSEYIEERLGICRENQIWT